MMLLWRINKIMKKKNTGHEVVLLRTAHVRPRGTSSVANKAGVRGSETCPGARQESNVETLEWAAPQAPAAPRKLARM